MSSLEEQASQVINMPSLAEMSGEDYKKEALQRAAKERRDIVNRYKKGMDSEEEEDNWLDANARIYKVTDRYGFLHEKELYEVPLEKERKAAEVKRQLKWVKMFQKWPSFVGTEKLRKRVYKGIPLNMRGDAWRLLLNVANLMKNEPTVYQEMRIRSHEHSPDIKQIDMDVNRTYRDHIMFRRRYSTKQQQLFDVLSAYSMYNTEVGYCQGMSQIAALLLMYMTEEEAFWALHSLLYGKKHLMHGFFIPGFPKLMRFQEHHDNILKKMMPRLKKHLDRNEIFASLYTMKWFFQCFLDRSPFPLTLRLWDIYVLEGERLLTAMSYTTLKMHKAVLKKMDMEGIVHFLQEQLSLDFGADDDVVVEQLKNNMNELRRASMDLPPPPGQDEMPKLPFGKKVQPTFEQETGLRQSVKQNFDRSSLKKPPHMESQKKKSGKKIKSSKEMSSVTNGAATASASSSASDAIHATSAAEQPDQNTSPAHRNEKKMSRKSSGRKSEADTMKKQEYSKRHKTKKGSKHLTPTATGTPADQTDVEASAPMMRTVESKTTSPNRTCDEKSLVKSSAKNTQTPAHLVLPSTDNYLSADSTSHSKHEPSPASNDSSSKMVWRTPVSNKVSSMTESSRKSPSKSSPVKWLTPDEPQTHSDSSTNNSTVKASGRSSSEQQALEISEMTPDEQLTNSISVASMPHRFSKTGIFSLQLASSSRPFSVYDNVKAGLAASEYNLDDDVGCALAPSAGAEHDKDSQFEAKMEESLENLRELTARLSRTPSPNLCSNQNESSQTRRRRPQLTAFTTDTTLHPPCYTRSRSLDPLGEEGDELPLGGAEANGKVTKSMSAMQLGQVMRDGEPPSSSAFQQAIADAGILPTLPKPPSSGNLNAGLFPRRTPVVTSKRDVVAGADVWVSRKKSSWSQAALDHQNCNYLTLIDFVNRDTIVRADSQPLAARIRVPQDNGSNNVAISLQLPKTQRTSVRPTQSSQYRQVDVPPKNQPLACVQTVPSNKYSRHGPGSANVLPHWVEAPAENWLDLTRLSPNHSPQIAHFSQQREMALNQSASHLPYYRANILHRQAGAAPPPNHHHSVRARRYVVPDEVTTVSTSSWLRSKRKNNASIAVRTEGAIELNRNTNV